MQQTNQSYIEDLLGHGYSQEQCNKALTLFHNDFYASINWLRENGLTTFVLTDTSTPMAEETDKQNSGICMSSDPKVVE